MLRQSSDTRVAEIFDRHPALVPSTSLPSASQGPPSQEDASSAVPDSTQTALRALHQHSIRLDADPSGTLPRTAIICPQDTWQISTAKVHVSFREALLRRMLDVQRILGNMVFSIATSAINACPRGIPTTVQTST